LGLALDYRPRRVSEIIGQPQISLVLGSLLSRWSNKDLFLPPALLLSGPRGSGKTSSARIVASYINCENREFLFSRSIGQSILTNKPYPALETQSLGSSLDVGESNPFCQCQDIPSIQTCVGHCKIPCLECAQCANMMRHASDVVVEIDAASHGLVDDIRELAKTARLVHTGVYRVFIIDEVHAATKEAFSALLKQLEEPLPNVLYILVTTNPSAIHETIISRCLHFAFRSISEIDIARRIEFVAKSEKMDYEPAVISLIAKRAKGALRDGLMLLEHLSIIRDVSVARFQSLWPDVLTDFAETFLLTARNGDAASGIKSVQSAYFTNRDVLVLVDAIIAKVSAEFAVDKSLIDSRTLMKLMELSWDLRIKARTTPVDSILLEALWHMYRRELSPITNSTSIITLSSAEDEAVLQDFLAGMGER